MSEPSDFDTALIRLSENYGVVATGPDWPVVYECEHDPRYVPKTVRALGGEVRHVMYWQPGCVQFWWQTCAEGDVWRYAEQSG